MSSCSRHRWAAWLSGCFLLASLHSQTPVSPPPKPIEFLQYGVEWRLVRAGTAQLARTAEEPSGWENNLILQSSGLISKLYRVNDNYRVQYDSSFCAATTFMRAEEGSRRREAAVTFKEQKSAYLERDTVKNRVVLQKELDIAPCTHDVIAALYRLRAARLAPGQSIQLPISDGKRMVNARVDAQEKETVKTPTGSYQAIRHEAHLFNDVLYARKGRLFLWLTDDDKRLPVQIRLKMNFPVGAITLQLEKTI
ncbi:MAG: DUF3108 domain-containing protein [Candidatus Solibacter usitatus]|nr:DUF3108 domain-containing protein [Candidatus Solibacter usitatus]